MPGRDGTGPMGAGRGGGNGGRGRQAGSGRGPAGIAGDAGAVAFCLCPKCGAKTPHQPGQACTSVQCPQCGAAMVRE